MAPGREHLPIPVEHVPEVAERGDVEVVPSPVLLDEAVAELHVALHRRTDDLAAPGEPEGRGGGRQIGGPGGRTGRPGFDGTSTSGTKENLNYLTVCRYKPL